MIADTDDADFAYKPGTLLVETRPARFNFGGGGSADSATALADYGPSTFSRTANFHPEPTDTELTALVMRSQRVLGGLTEENERLQHQVQALEKTSATGAPTASNPAPAGPAAGPGTIASTNGDDPHFNVIKPNRENVIELDPNFFVTPTPATNNPFVQLYRPPVSFREVPLVVSAAVPGPNPSAVLNDEPYGIGDSFEGLTVYRIEPDTVYLQKNSFVLACPVSEKPLKLRLP